MNLPFIHFDFISGVDDSVTAKNFTQVQLLIVWPAIRLTKRQGVVFVGELSLRRGHFDTANLDNFIFLEVDWCHT